MRLFVQLKKNLCLYTINPCQRNVCECVNTLGEKYSMKGSIVPKKEYDDYCLCKTSFTVKLRTDDSHCLPQK